MIMHGVTFVMLLYHLRRFVFFFFFNDTATTEIYTLSLHDALPIFHDACAGAVWQAAVIGFAGLRFTDRSEEHTSELQSLAYLVCRLLLEKKKNTTTHHQSLPGHNAIPPDHTARRTGTQCHSVYSDA